MAILICAACRSAAQALVVPDAETAYSPTRARIKEVLAAAKRDGWSPQVRPLHAAALSAYRRENLTAAEAWFHPYAWASLWSRTEGEFVQGWITAVNTARVGHANMASTYAQRAVPLGAMASPQLQAFVLEDAAFSAQFFGEVSALDFLPRVLEILGELQAKRPDQFRTYPSLALAIALVYDVPPPPHWPHAQVSATALPRVLPQPLEAFDWWVGQDRKGRTAHRLSRLPARELKYVVDVSAPLAELTWAQDALPVDLAAVPDLYNRVEYRTERVARNQPLWPGPTYRLRDLLETGGICADQAYFAAMVGKARGVPTLLFQGAGLFRS